MGRACETNNNKLYERGRAISNLTFCFLLAVRTRYATFLEETEKFFVFHLEFLEFVLRTLIPVYSILR